MPVKLNLPISPCPWHTAIFCIVISVVIGALISHLVYSIRAMDRVLYQSTLTGTPSTLWNQHTAVSLPRYHTPVMDPWQRILPISKICINSWRTYIDDSMLPDNLCCGILLYINSIRYLSIQYEL